jgi:hypothetical protein
METTIDLPDVLARAVRLRAIKEGRDFNDAVTDLVRIGEKKGTFTDPVHSE